MKPVLSLLDEDGLYGTAKKYGQSSFPQENSTIVERLRWVDDSLSERVNDLRAALGELDVRNASGPWQGRLNLDRVGVVGRSFGGATALAALLLEGRFTAGVAVVPPSLPDIRAMLPDEALSSGEAPTLAQRDLPSLTTLRKPTLLLSCAEDALIIGLAAQISTGFPNVPAPSPSEPHPVWRAAFTQTDQPVLWGLLADSNHASFGVSGGYWWPHLKPNTAPRAFEPETSFTLVDVREAHDLQSDKARQFFDYFIRQDFSIRDTLLDNPSIPADFVWESRNF